MQNQASDHESGLHYNYHRYYDPATGRYLTPDPIGFDGQDLNLFSYVRANPINRIDPEGLYDPFSGIKQLMKINPTFQVEVAAFKKSATKAVESTPILIAATGVFPVLEILPVVVGTAVYAALAYPQQVIDSISALQPGPPPPSRTGYVVSGIKFIIDLINSDNQNTEEADGVRQCKTK